MEMLTKVGKYTVEEFETNIKSEGNSSDQQNDSESSKNTNENSKKDSDKVSIMKSKYVINNEITDDEWNQINKDTLNLKTSWTAIQNDLDSNDRVSSQILSNVSNNIENLYICSNNKNKLEFMKEILEMYSNIIEISEKLEFDNNRLYYMKIKSKIYESYLSVLNKDWDMAKNKVELAKSYIQNIDNLSESDKNLIESMIDPINNKDEEKYIVKYNFIIKSLKDYNKEML